MGEESEESREGEVGVAVYELGRSPPYIKRHFFMARWGPTPTSAVLNLTNPTQDASEPVRGCPSSAVPAPAPRTALLHDAQQHRLPSALSPFPELVTESNFGMKCPYFDSFCFCLFY